jgi:ABC-2 type transport system ATP-binding protein
MLLQIQNLKKYYQSQKAVDDISFQISRGSIFGLLGPNGAGKSTLLRMITGIIHPDSGKILFEGRPFDASADTNAMGYMPEERGLYKKMKIGEHILYLAQLKGLDKNTAMERITHWFRKLDMGSWWDKKVGDLSKGMQQKLQFVATVIHEPSLLILDEPFSGLDPVNADVIKEQIYELAAKGTTVIFSTHRMEQVEEICDHIILINKGKLLLDGSVNGVKNQYKENKYLVRADNMPKLDNHAFQCLATKNDTATYQLAPNTSPNELLQALMNNGATVHGFTEQLPSLNDIFIQLVKNQGAQRTFETV